MTLKKHSSERGRKERGTAAASPKESLWRPGRLVTPLVVLAILVALLPVLIAKTRLRNMLVAAVLPGEHLRVTIGDASLGWFSPPSVSGVEVRDASGRPLAAAESVRLLRTPWALLTNRRELGEIEIQRPTVHLSIRPDGTNLENALAAWFPAADAPPAAGSTETVVKPQPVAYAVRVVEGTILAEEASTGRRWRVHNLNVHSDVGADGSLAQFSASGQLDAGAVGTVGGAPGPIPPGGFIASFTTVADGRQQWQWQAETIDLAVAEPWLRRFVAGAELRGALSGQGTAAWSDTAAQGGWPQGAGAASSGGFTTAGLLRIEQLEATAPPLAGDRLRMARVEMPWRVTAQPTGWAIETFELRSDIGQLAARGMLDPAVFRPPAGFDPAALLAAGRHDLEVRGELDLARLAAMLPRALRIRGDTTITSGTIQLAARSQPAEGGQSFSGTLRTAALAATSAGRTLSWQQPVNATFELRQEARGTRLESLRCDSEFLKIAAAGTSQQLTANAEFDLNKLATQLRQFLDLSGIELTGTGTAHLDWHQSGDDAFTAAANSDLAQLRVGLGDGRVWAEPRLAVKAEAAGTLDPATREPARVEVARVRLDAEGDQLDAELTAPVDLSAGAPVWPVTVRASGSVARWLTRARPWFSPAPWQVDGQSDVRADVRAGAATFDVANAKVSVSNLRIVGVGWSIAEPRVELAGDVHWSGATGEIAATSAQLVSSTVALAAQDVRLRPGDGGPPQMSGTAAFRADVARIAAWQATPGEMPEFQPQGMVTGNVRFDQLGDRMTGELTAKGENLALAARSSTSRGQAASRGVAAGQSGHQIIWREPQVALRSIAVYEQAADRLSLQQLQIQSNTLQATADGQIDQLTTAADLNASGTLSYDLAQITPLVRPYVGEGILLVGRETARFQVAGPLFAYPAAVGHWSRRVQARFDAPWSSASLYGLPVGGGKIAAALGDGAVRLDPLALAVAEGRLTAAPHVRLDPAPMELSLPAGPLLTEVRISPEVSETLLKYIAPVLAGATESDGKFSLALEGARVPLADAKRSDVAGQMTVHSVRVVPGPMVREWIGLAQQIEALAKRRDPTALAQRPSVTLLAIQDQQVNFRVLDGRVYHQEMQFQVGDVQMRSEGSVGLDETLALVLRIPIQEKWIEGQNLLVGLKGQSLSVPVSGTLSRPRMDQSAVAGLSQQLLQGAAQQAIGNELNKALDKLLKPR